MSLPFPPSLLQPKNPPVKKRESGNSFIIIDGDMSSNTLSFSPLKTILKIKECIANNRVSSARENIWRSRHLRILKTTWLDDWGHLSLSRP